MTQGPAAADAAGRTMEGFVACYGRARAGDVRRVFSPYRICPLGAHVDHQDGAVTGMAIDQGVVVAFAPRADADIRAASADFPGPVTFDLRAVPPAAPGEWGNFLRGAALVLQDRLLHDRRARGIDVFVLGQLPIGGLSSSAAVAIGYLLALEDANTLDVTPEENAALVHRIENQYVGLHAGVLDQSMILFARQDRLLRLDCRSGAREYVAFGELHGAPPIAPAIKAPAIAVAYSGRSQALVGTGYNQRVAECRAAATRLLELAGHTKRRVEGGIEGHTVPPGGARLRDVPPNVYARYGDALPAPLGRRAAHYFGEQRRVDAGMVAWRAGDRVRFGQLVAESGRSSIENYECGAPELVALYEAFMATPGVYGARFSGAGFRGSCLALIDPAAADAVGPEVRQRYLRAFPQYATTFGFFRCASGPPAGLLESGNPAAHPVS